jgi:hypothetical protein
LGRLNTAPVVFLNSSVSKNDAKPVFFVFAKIGATRAWGTVALGGGEKV